MPATRKRPLRGIVLALDALLVIASLALAGGLHAALRGHVPALKEPPRFQEYALIVYLSVPVWLLLTAMLGLDRVFERVWTRTSLLFDLIKLHVAGFLALSAAVFFTQTTLNRSLVALFLGSSFVLSYCLRSALASWRRYQHASGLGRTRLLVVGNPSPELDDLMRRIAAEPLPPIIVGQLGSAPVQGLAHLGGIETIERALHDQAADHVLFYPPYHRAPDIRAALDACDTVGVSAELALELSHPNDLTPRVVDLYGRPFLSFDPAPKPAERLAIKHAFDWIASVILLVLFAPLFLVVSLAILVTMGRPVFFSQTRAGLYGRQFKMIKFRTMVNNAEAKQGDLAAKNEMSGPVFKVTDDPRVTRLGRFLRKSSIDELPQLVNVFLGQMSLVGPRPLPIKEQQQIRGWHRRRLSMKPGITCIWQVSGRNNIDFEDWMSLDERYVDDWSLRLDLVILMKTVPVVLLRRGAR
jgi:exopolysaccharide biosynthesis polyprenyl glycosylphosphotransferase